MARIVIEVKDRTFEELERVLTISNRDEKVQRSKKDYILEKLNLLGIEYQAK